MRTVEEAERAVGEKLGHPDDEVTAAGDQLDLHVVAEA